ncbi:MAG: hypothetical protein MZV63_69310 [Marinilabiliales bacterium]|nr:hypothetical protein [Marinilabiliales bacterium]
MILPCPSFEQFCTGMYETNYKMLKFLNPWLRKPFLTNSERQGVYHQGS